jgi:hypothetical protein
MGSPDSTTARIHASVDASEKWDLRLWGTIAILCGALFFDAMDSNGQIMSTITKEAER